MGFPGGIANSQYSLAQVAAANLNQAEDTVLLAAIFFPAGGFIQRFGVVAEAAEGLLAPNELRLRSSVDGGATYVDRSTNDAGENAELDVVAARARGVDVYKDVGMTIAPNTLVVVASKVAAGGTSTGRVWMEYALNPFNGGNIPTTAVEAP
jgi:hypothetical protein